jgi:subtilisin family serine protease
VVLLEQPLRAFREAVRNITSTWNSGDSATNTISGTSMATPHVAGAGPCTS